MFFLPIIKWLKKLKIRVTIVCCTTGNYDGLGDTRRIEFEKVCEFLGARSVMIEDQRLQDGWEMWDAGATAEVRDKMCTIW
ncbi:n-acetylglucosaminyl-phosphatidylinositol de-n-acetylase, putative [Perkinsus marinus ATCC 50983]|uniref:N-acetylglucosaminylphosphatidylinositol deacetylase n=1 Tax=Perkinsus marinus (strain ATCC 50983 / TXsc) TaxID=423536 RepID=C5L9M6_PERM5|nr:n-acetylglucosaminyl-phosphatidylinositol de-n-acetylase, putative [Perkinsus marinus ATCC 50983]EER06566.1 n-acetylglucosaminyl-phosphatidylinositol de-n-acetylase, putative [Perkinsus marinus ATCC 50983]|eukprot:XP_002774750.1 n-acetylglucosaminyl-phosphatidylinositol de-n-acetylase, putative [Perkinsus marinus ATCC 50983]